TMPALVAAVARVWPRRSTRRAPIVKCPRARGRSEKVCVIAAPGSSATRNDARPARRPYASPAPTTSRPRKPLSSAGTGKPIVGGSPTVKTFPKRVDAISTSGAPRAGDTAPTTSATASVIHHQPRAPCARPVTLDSGITQDLHVFDDRPTESRTRGERGVVH